MSKSIYEEVLEKIDLEFDSWDRAEHFELVELVEQALEKAMKQEKLLELYKELSKLKDDVIHLVMFVKDYEHLRVKTVKIEQQIKELEK